MFRHMICKMTAGLTLACRLAAVATAKKPLTGLLIQGILTRGMAKKPLIGPLFQGQGMLTHGMTKKPLTGLLIQGILTRGMAKKPLTGLLFQGQGILTRGMDKKPLAGHLTRSQGSIRGICTKIQYAAATQKLFSGLLSLSRGMAKKPPQWPPAPFPKPPPITEYAHLSNTERKDSGFPCSFDEPSLLADEAKARTLTRSFNLAAVDNHAKRAQILQELLNPESSSKIQIEPPFYVDYGYNITIGENSFINFDCIFLDTAPITIGVNVLIAPRVSIFAGGHPIDPKARQEYSLAKPIRIGNNTWIGGASVICPGVTIGDGCVVAAGSTVTKNVPSFCLVGGNPARIIKYFPGASQPKPPKEKK